MTSAHALFRAVGSVQHIASQPALRCSRRARAGLPMRVGRVHPAALAAGRPCAWADHQPAGLAGDGFP